MDHQQQQQQQRPGPSLPAALPRLDLKRPPEGARQLANVVLSSAALEGGLRTHTCPQCGMNPSPAMVKRTFQFVPPWVYLGLLMNVLVLMIMYFIGRRVVKAELSLCSDCDAADRRARTIQSVSIGGLIGFPIVLGLGLWGLLGGEAGVFGAAAGVVSGIVGMIAAHRGTRHEAIRCVNIDKKAGTITLKATDTFAQVIAAEAPAALP